MEGFAGITSLWHRLERLDQDLTLALNALHSPVSDAVWLVFSDRLLWVALYLAVAVALVMRLGWKRGLIAVASIILTIVMADQFSNLVKYSVMRLRPGWDPYMVGGGVRLLDGQGGYYGFFSAHAANATAFAVSSVSGFKLNTIGLRYRKYAWIISLWAFCVGISRVFVGRHFVGDVLIGFAAGVLIALVVSGITRSYVRRNRRRLR